MDGKEMFKPQFPQNFIKTCHSSLMETAFPSSHLFSSGNLLLKFCSVDGGRFEGRRDCFVSLSPYKLRQRLKYRCLQKYRSREGNCLNIK